MKSIINADGNRLEITRVFDAPRAEVFSWWSSAEKLAQWSGCKETVRCEVSMDFRAGGSFTQKMRISTQGGECDFTLTGIYEEISVPERIVYRADMGVTTVRVRVEFFEHGDQTKVVLMQKGFPDANVSKIVSIGTDESLERLDAILIRQAARV